MKKPCCEKTEITKGAWSKQEDQKLTDYIQKHGQGCWNSLPKAAGLRRCGKSCRLRWINYLRPDLKRGSFGEDEEDLIIRLHALLGNRWSLIAGRLPGRTDNEVKNYWNSHIRKKLLKMGSTGLDPKKPHSHDHHHLRGGSSTSANSTKIKRHAANKLVLVMNLHGIHINHDDDDQAALDSMSTGANEVITTKSCLPDLNLDLTLSTTSPNISGGREAEKYE